MNWLIEFEDEGQSLTELTVKEVGDKLKVVDFKNFGKVPEFESFLRLSIAEMCEPERTFEDGDIEYSVKSVRPTAIYPWYQGSSTGIKKPEDPILVVVVIEDLESYVYVDFGDELEIIPFVYAKWPDKSRRFTSFIEYYNSQVFNGNMRVASMQEIELG